MAIQLVRTALASVLAAIMINAIPAPVQAQTAKAPAMPRVGDMAPDFNLQYFDGGDLKDVSLSQYRGKKNVVLAFYIFAFTGG